MFFLQDYQEKRRFHRFLTDYYVAGSLCEWSYEKYLVTRKKQYFFQEGNVILVEGPQWIRLEAKVKQGTYVFLKEYPKE